MAESHLLSNTVVEDLDVFRDLAFGLLTGGEAVLMHQLRLQFMARRWVGYGYAKNVCKIR